MRAQHLPLCHRLAATKTMRRKNQRRRLSGTQPAPSAAVATPTSTCAASIIHSIIMTTLTAKSRDFIAQSATLWRLGKQRPLVGRVSMHKTASDSSRQTLAANYGTK